VGDHTTAKIDRFFDILDAGIEEATHLLDRVQKSHGVIDRADARRRVIDVDARDARPAKKRASKVRIIESIDAQTGSTVYVVTDGITRRECNTRELADRFKEAMEAVP